MPLACERGCSYTTEKENGPESFDAFALEDFTKPERIVQIGYLPYRIDVIPGIDGVEFEDAYPNRKVFEVDGLPVAFIGLEDLKTNKKASGRRKDIEDLKNLGEQI